MLAQFKSLKILQRVLVRGKCVARTNMSSMLRKCDFIYISFPDRPVYLNRTEGIETESSQSVNENTSQFFNSGTECFIVFADDSCDNNFQSEYIKSAIKAQTLYRKSAEWNKVRFSHSLCKVSNDASIFYKRGVCLYNHAATEIKSLIPEELCDLAKQNSAFVPFELSRLNKNGTVTLKCLHGSSSGDHEICFNIASRPMGNRSDVSPLFAVQEISPVFHSYEEARNVLEKIQDVPEVKELLQLSSKNVSMEILKAHYGNLPHPFVVVEGMDATGKTTLTEELEKRMGAVRYYTPPRQITDLRAHFDKYPEIVRRAYYSMGNYIVAMEILEECQSRPVIMDRFWHSTTAYAIANETSSGDIPDVGHLVYDWPADLVRPTLVLFLTVSEEVRKQRLSGRGLQATFEEKSLDKDWLFRQRLCEAYRRMSKPGCVEIDAGGTVEEVRNKAMKVLQANGVDLSRD